MKPDSEGTEAKKTEQFVLDAYTYTEAETRMVEVLESEGIRPFEITQITKTTLIEVIRFAECDKWFRVKISLSTVDESKGVEKEANQYILVSATDVRDAYDKASGHMNAVKVGYIIPSVVYQKIAEVFPLEEWTPATTSMIGEDSNPQEVVDEQTGEILIDQPAQELTEEVDCTCEWNHPITREFSDYAILVCDELITFITRYFKYVIVNADFCAIYPRIPSS